MGFWFIIEGDWLQGIILFIFRFDIDLGKLLDCLETNHTYGSIFGFIEIKP
jgi:hypothetical protein